MKKILVVILFFSSSVWAFSTQTFDFSNSFNTVLTEDALHSEYSGFSLEQRWMLKSSLTYIDDPLIAVDASRGSELRKIVDSETTLEFGFSYLLTKKLLFSADLNINQVKTTDKHIDLGDTQLVMKYNFYESHKFAFAISGSIEFPTGNVENFTSNDSVGAGVLISGEYHNSRLHLFSHFGYKHSTKAKFYNVDLSDRLISAIAINYDMTNYLTYNLEVLGQVGTNFKKDQNPVDVITGVKYKINSSLNSFVGIGLGALDLSSSDSVHSNDFRVYAGLKWIPQFSKKVQHVTVRERENIKKVLLNLQAIRFEVSTAKLTESSKKILLGIVKVLRRNESGIKNILVEGHTDQTGNAFKNRVLSLQRANAVKMFLFKHGLNPKKIQAVGYGQSRPKIFPEKNAHDRRINRRVEFKLIYF